MLPKVKIIASLVIAFVAVTFLAPQVFIADSPRVNPLFIAKLKNAPSYIASLPENLSLLFQSGNKTSLDDKVLTNIPETAPPAGLLFQTVSKGVKAAEDKINNKKYMKIEAGTELEVNVFKLKDGREIKIIRPVKNK